MFPTCPAHTAVAVDRNRRVWKCQLGPRRARVFKLAYAYNITHYTYANVIRYAKRNRRMYYLFVYTYNYLQVPSTTSPTTWTKKKKKTNTNFVTSFIAASTPTPPDMRSILMYRLWRYSALIARKLQQKQNTAEKSNTSRPQNSPTSLAPTNIPHREKPDQVNYRFGESKKILRSILMSEVNIL